MDKSRVKNKYVKWPSRENYLNYKKIKNKCNSLTKKAKKKYFQNVSNQNSSTSKKFWNTVKPFMTNKGAISNENIIIKNQMEESIKVKGNENETLIEANELIREDKILVELFNKHYINIVEKTSGKKPSCIGNPENPMLD